jgi:hypothetical protein
MAETRERCPCCGQVVPLRCVVCGVYAVNTGGRNGRPSHQADHPATGEDGRCERCGLPTRDRMGRVGHVFDHEAQLPGG